MGFEYIYYIRVKMAEADVDAVSDILVSVQELIRRLKELEALPLETKDIEYMYFENDEADGQVAEAQCMADDVLITDDGRCHMDNIELMKEAGFNVTTGEEDRFGYLRGCIHTAKGFILFG